MRGALLAACLIGTDSFQPKQFTSHKRTLHGTADDYTQRWDTLVLEEYRATASELRRQRATWPKRRLEEAGVSLFGTAAPHSELFGEKILRVTRSGETSRVREQFTRGDVLTLTFDAAAAPREVAVVETGVDWLTVAVGETWPGKTWEARRRPGSVSVRLDKSAPRAPLAAQRDALSRVAAGKAVGVRVSDLQNCAIDARGSPVRIHTGLGCGEPRDRSRRHRVRRSTAPPRWRRGGGVRGNPGRGDGADVGDRHSQRHRRCRCRRAIHPKRAAD